MVRVEGGTFTMGATSEQGSDAEDSEKPAHQVTLSSYSIGETEVTQELWEAVMGKNPSTFKGNKRPVENVGWDDCKVFIQKLNEKTGKYFRLPTEAEWEFAARGGVRSRRYKYSGSNDIDAVAWYDDTEDTLDILDYFDDDEDVQNGTNIVKTKQANELGLYDMSGNVCEWCSDFFGDYNSSTQTNPKGASSGDFRVLRGGSWNSKAKNCRNSVRDYASPQYHNKAGLRLVLSESYTDKNENKTENKDNNKLDSPSWIKRHSL
jgi:formylglycine-generating enzyme required for sulfatase activity